MSQGQFTFVAAGTRAEPSKIEVRKDGRAIGRILHRGERPHEGAIFQFHKGISITLNESAQYSNLEELKNWIRETQ
jgi:hypothetical protein